MTAIHESFLIPFFEEMNLRYPGKWCVLHAYDTLPSYSESDVDMAFTGKEAGSLEAFIREVGSRTGWQLYQKLWYDIPDCQYYVVRDMERGNYLALDFLVDQSGYGKYGFPSGFLTKECRFTSGNIPIPNPSTAFCYKLVKRIVKDRDLEEDRSFLISTFKKADIFQIQKILSHQFGRKGSDLIMASFNGGKNDLDSRERRILNRKKRLRTMVRGKMLVSYFLDLRRIFYRMMHPRGMVINLPILPAHDLVSFHTALEEKLGILFRKVELEHESSSLQRFKALAGSSLLICVDTDFTPARAIKYHWKSGTWQGLGQLDFSEINDIPLLAERYYQAILETLHMRISSDHII